MFVIILIAELLRRMEIYHEKQRLQFCAVHAINNLFQDGSFCSKQTLDAECHKLNPHWNNPHKSMLGIGNYDVNAIMSFLESKDYNVIWFDKRKSTSVIKTHEVFGFLVNTVSTYKVFGKQIDVNFFKHWFAVRKMANGLYFNLDSKLAKPANIGNDNQLIEYFSNKLAGGQTELLLITEKSKDRESIFEE